MSSHLNVPTYPGELIYVPDMLVAIVALSNYSKQYNGEFLQTVLAWESEMRSNWMDKESGLIMSYIPENEYWEVSYSAKGSYSALSCYYLSFVDEEFAREQYARLKESFYQRGPVAGFKEYYDRK